MTKAKGIKKVKAIKGDKSIEQLNIETPPPVVNTTYPIFISPDKNEKLTGTSKLTIGDKVKDFKSLTSIDLDINLLNVSDLVKKLFIQVMNGYELVNTRLTFHNASYGPCFGFTVAQDVYKCMFAHHKGNGINALVVNQCNLYLYVTASEALKKQDVTISQGRGGKANWGIVNINESNIDGIIASMLAIGIIKAKVIEKQD